MEKVLVLSHVGRDNWNRPVYECEGRLYVDADPRKSSRPEICTKQNNDFYGEPCDRVESTEFKFTPRRDTWDF